MGHYVNLRSLPLSTGTAIPAYSNIEGFADLSKRYAANLALANGRFLWRNRVGAENIEVRVKVCNEGEQRDWTFSAKSISVRDFDNLPAGVLELAELIANALSGRREFLLLSVTAYAQVGLAQDVYPSEELVLDKSNSKSKKSKILYHIDGHAGMHSQKIGNALRSIDTWYPVDEDNPYIGPIAIEPYGAVTNLGKAFRTPKAKVDFYTLFDSFARGGSLSQTEQHYVMAVLVRGGVFGESGKD